MDSTELALQRTSAIRQHTENILHLADDTTIRPSNSEDDSSSLRMNETTTNDTEGKNSDNNNFNNETIEKKTLKTTHEDPVGVPTKLTANVSDTLTSSLDGEDFPGATAVPGFHPSATAATVTIGNTSNHIPSEHESIVAKAVTREDLEDEVRRQLLSEVTIAEAVEAMPPSDPEAVEAMPPSDPEAASLAQGGGRVSDASRNPSVRYSMYRMAKNSNGENGSKDNSSRSRRKIIFWIGGCILLIAVIAGVLVGLLGSLSKDDQDSMEDEPLGQTPYNETQTQVVSQAKDLLSFLENESRQSLGNQEALNDETSPQRRAYEWLKENDFESLALQDKDSQDYVLQLYGMVSFYYATNGGNWTQNNLWLDPNSSVCEWYPGDLCEDDTRQLRRRTQKQQSQFDQVEKLVLVENNLVGTLPHELGFLKELELWNLDDNLSLVGTLPTTINKLRKLDRFSMRSAGLTGSFPSTWSGMEDLLFFVMPGVSGMSGPFPYDLWSKAGLRELNLEGIGLTGTLPISVDQPNRAYLANNKLSGSIPLSASNDWVGLAVLDLSFNELTGTIPTELATNFDGDMRRLWLGGNPLLTGSVPAAVCEAFERKHEGLSVEFSTDCLDPTTGVECSCCTLCCSNGEDCQ